MTILIILILSIICSIFYRLGGSAHYNTKYRDMGCMVCTMLSLFVLGIHGAWWQWLLAAGLTFGALTTYHKWINRLLGGKSDHGYWYNWFAHGFILGLAIMPFSHLWFMILMRSIALGIFTMIWSEGISNDVMEEVGRGFLLNISLLFLL